MCILCNTTLTHTHIEIDRDRRENIGNDTETFRIKTENIILNVVLIPRILVWGPPLRVWGVETQCARRALRCLCVWPRFHIGSNESFPVYRGQRATAAARWTAVLIAETRETVIQNTHTQYSSNRSRLASNCEPRKVEMANGKCTHNTHTRNTSVASTKNSTYNNVLYILLHMPCMFSISAESAECLANTVI